MFPSLAVKALLVLKSVSRFCKQGLAIGINLLLGICFVYDQLGYIVGIGGVTSSNCLNNNLKIVVQSAQKGLLLFKRADMGAF